MQHICKNCGNQYEGNYCNQCGQKSKVDKLTLRSVVDNWAYGLTNCDTGILFTYLQLFTRPGHMLADYIEGKRVIYFQPFPMLFITAGLYGLLSEILLVPDTTEVTAPINASISFSERFMHLVSTWIYTSPSLSAILSLPFFAWAAKMTFRNPSYRPYSTSPHQYWNVWLCFWCTSIGKRQNQSLSDYLFTAIYTSRLKYLKKKKYGYNFTEYIFIFAYIACQRLVVGILFVLPLLVYTHSRHLTGNLYLLTSFIYFLLLIWDFKQLFHLTTSKTIKKVFGLLLNSLLILFILMLLLTGITVAVLLINE